MMDISSISDPSGAPRFATTEWLLILLPRIIGLQKMFFRGPISSQNKYIE